MNFLLKRLKQSNNIYLSIFLALTFTFTSLGLLYICLKHGQPMRSLIWNAPTGGVCPDFFETIKDAKYLRPYDGLAVYPALVYLLPYPLSNLLTGSTAMWDQTPYTYEWLKLSYTQNGILLVFFFYIFFTLALIELVSRISRIEGIKKIILTFLFICSPGYIFMIDRGNIVILSAFFIVLYLISLKSNSKLLHEIGLVSLAFAACFKIYPAIFGLLLLIDKKYKDAIKAVFYGIFFFLAPFIFTGGKESFINFVNNIFILSNDYATNLRGFGYGYKINFINMVDAICNWILHRNVGGTFSLIISLIIFAIIIWIVVYNRERWIKIFALTSGMILVPGFSLIYTAVYLIIPLAAFFNKTNGVKEVTKQSLLYTFLFSLEFSIFPYGYIMKALPGDNKMSITTIILSMALILLLIVCFIDTVKGFRKKTLDSKFSLKSK